MMARAQPLAIPDNAAVSTTCRTDAALPTLALTACDCAFAIECPDDETATLLDVVFGALLIPSTAGKSTVSASLRIERGGQGRGYRIREVDAGSTPIADADALLFHVDKWLTIALQRQRPELYFVHAAAVANRDRVAVMAAPPTTGKSTLTLALLERGLAYLSDELAPVDAAYTPRIPVRPRGESQVYATGSGAPAERGSRRWPTIPHPGPVVFG